MDKSQIKLKLDEFFSKPIQLINDAPLAWDMVCCVKKWLDEDKEIQPIMTKGGALALLDLVTNKPRPERHEDLAILSGLFEAGLIDKDMEITSAGFYELSLHKAKGSI